MIAIATSGAAAADRDALLDRLGELAVERIVISDRPAAIAGGALMPRCELHRIDGLLARTSDPGWIRDAVVAVGR